MVEVGSGRQGTFRAGGSISKWTWLFEEHAQNLALYSGCARIASSTNDERRVPINRRPRLAELRYQFGFRFWFLEYRLEYTVTFRESVANSRSITRLHASSIRGSHHNPVSFRPSRTNASSSGRRLSTGRRGLCVSKERHSVLFHAHEFEARIATSRAFGDRGVATTVVFVGLDGPAFQFHDDPMGRLGATSCRELTTTHTPLLVLSK